MKKFMYVAFSVSLLSCSSAMSSWNNNDEVVQQSAKGYYDGQYNHVRGYVEPIAYAIPASDSVSRLHRDVVIHLLTPSLERIVGKYPECTSPLNQDATAYVAMVKQIFQDIPVRYNEAAFRELFENKTVTLKELKDLQPKLISWGSVVNVHPADDGGVKLGIVKSYVEATVAPRIQQEEAARVAAEKLGRAEEQERARIAEQQKAEEMRAAQPKADAAAQSNALVAGAHSAPKTATVTVTVQLPAAPAAAQPESQSTPQHLRPLTPSEQMRKNFNYGWSSATAPRQELDTYVEPTSPSKPTSTWFLGGI